MRITNQREIILDELKRLKSHPTADELYEIVKKRLPRISIATVYRNLEQLSEAGIINKIEYGGRQKRFDGDTSPHSHIFCVKCGKISDVEIEEELDVKKIIKNSNGFQVFKDKLEFCGLCPECQKLNKTNNNKLKDI